MEEAAKTNSPAVPEKAPIRVAAICGSLRKGSCNRGLIRAAIEISKESIGGMIIEYIDISPLPLLNTDLEVNGTFPPEVEAFRDKIRQADSVLFASPDYNYSVTAPLKNAIDWGSRPPNVWADKAAALVGAAGGTGGALQQYHVRQIGVFLNLHFVNKPEFFLRRPLAPPQKCDEDGNLIDGEVRERLKEVLLSLYAFTLRLRASLNDIYCVYFPFLAC
ncbi:NADPH:quinone oxidoreductase [Coffea arabica]|uniref:NAD(P)H dehydrogenase (quinone) n=1 Tax=Coffea arabica TaxID=13443 RepID=A0A6P6VRT9_COFAR